ncbi:MAG: UDP-glucose 4-epimerase [Pseudonocardiales bacterium]|nr:MAG: UDP-glucose 4-epimerase [Pseudonocardiales bacterium]
MRFLVTGAAGFIGSQVAEALLARGDDVLGIDAFTDYYDVAIKHRNLVRCHNHSRFQFVPGDLTHLALDELLDDVDVVFHLAGQPGVRLSWSDNFAVYVHRNILATQALLEACRRAGRARIVFASSSSVYGNQANYPCAEHQLPRPHNPYGVTKLAAEQLCMLYAENWDLQTVALRYFTVYGPRQRPDMAMNRFIDAAVRHRAVPLYGDGSQVRDFTFVSDVVEATVLAGLTDLPRGSVLNVAGSESATVNDALALVAEETGELLEIDPQPAQTGDVPRTGGSIDRAREMLGWEPAVGLAEGIRQQVAWQLDTAARPAQAS